MKSSRSASQGKRRHTRRQQAAAQKTQRRRQGVTWQELEQLAIAACREGRFAGYRHLANQPDRLTHSSHRQEPIPPSELATWRDGWLQTKQKAEEDMRIRGTVIHIRAGQYKGRYGVVENGFPPEDSLTGMDAPKRFLFMSQEARKGIVRIRVLTQKGTFGSFAHLSELDTCETFSIALTWNPGEPLTNRS